MKCEAAKAFFMDYLYDEISETDRAQVEAHFQVCPACLQEINNLKQTSSTLRVWEDEPSPLNMVFMEDKQSYWPAFWEKIKFLFPRKLSWGKGLAFGLGVALVLLSIMNFEAKWEENRFAVSMSLFPKSQAVTSDGVFVTHSELERMKEEQVLLVNQLIEASEAKQQQQLSQAFINFARDVDQQRATDLQVVGTSFEQLQMQTNHKLQQTHRSIDDLIQQIQMSNPQMKPQR